MADAAMWIPDLSFHIFVKNTPQFQKPFDTYTNWTCFIADEGEFEYRMTDKGRTVDVKGKAATDDIVICPPGVTFYRTTKGVSFHFIRFAWLSKDDADIRGIVPDHGKIRLADNGRLRSTLSFLREYGSVNSPVALHFKKHLFRDLWLVFAMESTATAENASSYTSADPLLHQAMQLIHEHIDVGSPLKHIARQLHISQVQLTRLFQKEFHFTPHRYLSEIRMKEVTRLLVHSPLTLAQIAERCGFTDEHHLSKTFKKNIGMNPSVYRKINQV